MRLHRPFSANSGRHPSDFGKKRRLAGWQVRLLQVNGLIVPSLVELCTPHLVHALVLGSAECHGRPEPNVEVAEIFESCYQSFGVELSAISFQRCDQHVGRHVPFEGYVVRRLPRKVFE